MVIAAKDYSFVEVSTAVAMRMAWLRGAVVCGNRKRVFLLWSWHFATSLVRFYVMEGYLVGDANCVEISYTESYTSTLQAIDS